MFTVILVVLAISLPVYFLLLRKHSLSHVPGPIPLPLLGNSLQLAQKQVHLSMQELAKKYGPVYRLTFQGKPCLIVCDFPSIYEVLVSKSADFAGRSVFYLSDVLTEGQSGIFRTDAGPEVQGRRKLVHTYLRQYGAGMKRLQDVTMEVTADMIQHLIQLNGEPVDIREVLFRCTSDIMAILLIGDRFSDEMLEETNKVLASSATALAKTMSSEIVNQFPFMRHFGNRAYNSVVANTKARDRLIAKWLDPKPDNGFINFIETLSKEDKQKFHIAEQRELKLTLLNFYFAGVFTTSTTLTILMNVLCHIPEVQDKLRKEIQDVIGDSRMPCLADRDEMPYHNATILEIGRFASIIPLNLPHKTVRDTTLEATGRAIFVPAGTEVLTHLWSMHHDEQLWQDPYSFDPERFLDDAGQLVDANHPNRRHVMAFSAGHRVCVGEVLAMSRMFLVMSRLVKTFRILPESTMEAQPSHDPRNLKYGTGLTPEKFKVRLQLVDK